MFQLPKTFVLKGLKIVDPPHRKEEHAEVFPPRHRKCCGTNEVADDRNLCGWVGNGAKLPVATTHQPMPIKVDLNK